jgi:hypothetical protein|tara:strand:+ start:185 stop:520 length:336 start_codon:yes stop_codon:yes gene_type:complete
MNKTKTQQSVELLTEAEIQEIVIPSPRDIRTKMPHRVNPNLTEEDKEYLQKHRNKQDIIHSLVTQFLGFIRKQPEYVKKEHYHQALTIAANSGVFRKPEQVEEEVETNEDK